jgi:hypothetical protein
MEPLGLLLLLLLVVPVLELLVLVRYQQSPQRLEALRALTRSS